MIARPGSSGDSDSTTVTVCSPRPGPIDEQLDGVAGFLAGQRIDEIVDRAEHLPIGLEDRVGRIDLLVGREVLLAHRAVVRRP